MQIICENSLSSRTAYQNFDFTIIARSPYAIQHIERLSRFEMQIKSGNMHEFENVHFF